MSIDLPSAVENQLRALAAHKHSRRSPFALQIVDQSADARNTIRQLPKPGHFGPGIPFKREVVTGETNKSGQRN